MCEWKRCYIQHNAGSWKIQSTIIKWSNKEKDYLHELQFNIGPVSSFSWEKSIIGGYEPTGNSVQLADVLHFNSV